MERPPLMGRWLSLIVFVAALTSGCASGSEANVSKDEVDNFKNGMSAERRKEIGPAPTPPPGPRKGNEHGSAADKAQGR